MNDNEIPEEVEELSKTFNGGWWNYRFVATERTYKQSDGTKMAYTTYELMEIYYDELGEPIAWCNSSSMSKLESYSEMKDIMKSMKKASKMPVLKFIKTRLGRKLVKTTKKFKDIKES